MLCGAESLLTSVMVNGSPAGASIVFALNSRFSAVISTLPSVTVAVPLPPSPAPADSAAGSLASPSPAAHAARANASSSVMVRIAPRRSAKREMFIREGVLSNDVKPSKWHVHCTWRAGNGRLAPPVDDGAGESLLGRAEATAVGRHDSDGHLAGIVREIAP